jgi:hypothetical protein
MHKYITLFFLAAIFLCACGGGKTQSDIIGKQEMTSLITDLIIVDGTMYNTSPAPDSLYKYGTGRYLALFKRYHTDSVQFDRSFKYYMTQPAALQAMCDQAAQNIKDKTDSLNKLVTKKNTVHALPK